MSIHQVIARQPAIVNTIVNRAKQMPVGSNINSGRYIRESMVKIGEKSNKHNVFLPTYMLTFTTDEGRIVYAQSKKLTIK